MKIHFVFVTAVVCFVAASSAQAVLTTYSGLNTAPGGAVSGAPATAHSAFLASLLGVVNEDFESFTVGTLAPLSLSFSGSTLTDTDVTGTDQIQDDTSTGRFNTTPGGSIWWEAQQVFNIAFTTPIAAFGFYATDVGDLGGLLTLELTDSSSSVSSLGVTTGGAANDGELLFFGFRDSSKTYKNIAFLVTNNPNGEVDGIGFDDMVIGTLAPATVPEPATLVLLGLGLAGLGFSRRKR